MHEQSETLAELDEELRAAAEGRGLDFYRVPIPHLAPDFVSMLADLVEATLSGETARRTRPDGDGPALYPCRCKPSSGTVCTNGGRP
jgi:ferrochelatase